MRQAVIYLTESHMAKYDRKMQDLKTRLSEIYDIDMMQSLLGWNQNLKFT